MRYMAQVSLYMGRERQLECKATASCPLGASCLAPLLASPAGQLMDVTQWRPLCWRVLRYNTTGLFARPLVPAPLWPATPRLSQATSMDH